MSEELGQNQNLGLQQKLSPQQAFSLEILHKNSQELASLIKTKLNENPLLEEMGSDTDFPTQGQNPDDEDFSAEIYDSTQETSPEDSQKYRDFALNSIPDKISLDEYLLNEAKLDAKDEETAHAFAHLCSLLDERGFLPSNAKQSAIDAGFSPEKVKDALCLLRSSEPYGIGAFDLRDSFMIQLAHAKMKGSLAYKILDNDYELLINRKISEIAKVENRTEAQVEDAIAQIARLNMAPARDFSTSENKYIYPDVEFYKDPDEHWCVKEVEGNYPKIKINGDYRKLTIADAVDAKDKDFIRTQIAEAKSLLEAIESRRNTILKICTVLAERQKAFLEDGIGALKPLTMQEVAEEIGVNPTTVGRAIAGKYADTPRGITPLRGFFSGGLSAEDGEAVASSSVKEKIRELISKESQKSPLSDSKIAEMLAEEGIEIARRTVSKYREELGYPPKNLRRIY